MKKEKTKLYILEALLLAFLLIPMDCFATVNEVNIYFFHSATCDICKQEKTYLQALKDRYPNFFSSLNSEFYWGLKSFGI